MGRYHREVGFPEGIALPKGLFPITLSQHAREEAARDRLELPTHLDTRLWVAFEVRTNEAGKVLKVAYRRRYDDRRDAIIVVATDRMVVVTAWANHLNDSHRTLDESVYDKPQRTQKCQK